MTKILNYTFNGCKALKYIKIPDGLTEIGCQAFKDCKKLSSVTIPDSVKSIYNEAFSGCEHLKDIKITDDKIDIGTDAFFNTAWYNSQPDGLIILGKTLISTKNLNSSTVTIPEYITKIGNSAFAKCKSLENIILPDNIKEIGRAAFFFCTNLKSVVLPHSISIIYNLTFAWCVNLTKIIIPKTITQIGASAFLFCAKLNKVCFEGGIPDYVNKKYFESFMENSEFFLKENAFQSEYIPEYALSHINTSSVSYEDFAYILLNKTGKAYLRFLLRANTSAVLIMQTLYKFNGEKKLLAIHAKFITKYIIEKLQDFSNEDISAALDFFKKTNPNAAKKLQALIKERENPNSEILI